MIAADAEPVIHLQGLPAVAISLASHRVTEVRDYDAASAYCVPLIQVHTLPYTQYLCAGYMCVDLIIAMHSADSVNGFIV